MSDANSGLTKVTLALWLMIVGCLSVAALGGIFKSPLLVYFWYLALAGIVAMLLLTALLALSWIGGVLVRRLRHLPIDTVPR